MVEIKLDTLGSVQHSIASSQWCVLPFKGTVVLGVALDDERPLKSEMGSDKRWMSSLFLFPFLSRFLRVHGCGNYKLVNLYIPVELEIEGAIEGGDENLGEARQGVS